MRKSIFWIAAFVSIFTCLQLHAEEVKDGDVELMVGETLDVQVSSSLSNTLHRSVISSYSWTSANESVFKVTSSEAYGATIKGLRDGKAKLSFVCRYRVTGQSRVYTMNLYYNVTVKEESITITPHTLTLNVGETCSVSATQKYTIGGAYFQSSNNSVATVTLGEQDGYNSKTITGTITAVSEGTAYIYAKTLSGLSDVCVVTVKSNGPTSIYTTPASLDLKVGDQYMVKANIKGSGGTYSWTTTDASVATVSGSGLSAIVTAVGAGKAKVYVTANNGLQAYSWVTVTNPILKGDVNGDGVVNVSDVTDLVDYILNGVGSSLVVEACDINDDNVVNVSDITEIVNIILSN